MAVAVFTEHFPLGFGDSFLSKYANAKCIALKNLPQNNELCIHQAKQVFYEPELLRHNRTPIDNVCLAVRSRSISRSIGA
jgi:hypothetical protein